jgi:ribosomal protein S3
VRDAQSVTVTVYANKTLMVQGRKGAVLDWIDSTIPMLLAETADYRLTAKGKTYW